MIKDFQVASSFFLGAYGSKGACESAPVTESQLPGLHPAPIFCLPENWFLCTELQPSVGWEAQKASGRR